MKNSMSLLFKFVDIIMKENGLKKKKILLNFICTQWKFNKKGSAGN